MKGISYRIELSSSGVRAQKGGLSGSSDGASSEAYK